MSIQRKLCKAVEEGKPKPAIIFLPDDNLDGMTTNTITVTDPVIYTRTLEVLEQALEAERPGVTRSEG